MSDYRTWYTGTITRMCECGVRDWPSPCLRIITDGKSEWATCHVCGKTWDMATLKEFQESALVKEMRRLRAWPGTTDEANHLIDLAIEAQLKAERPHEGSVRE